MAEFLHQLLAGIVTGGVYSSLALALVMIFQSTHHVNFAQGEMAMFCTYIALALVQAGMPYWVAFVLTILAGMVIGALIQRLLMQPLADAPVLSAVGVFIGLLLIFNAMAGALFGFTIKNFPSPFGSGRGFFGGYMSPQDLGSTGVTLLMLLLVWAFFRFTRLGLGMRAAAYNPVSARLVGVPVDRMLALGWALAAAIGAVAGMMVAPIVYLEPNMMQGILLYAFAAALLGGITSPLGAVVGGLLVGVIENLAGAYLVGSELKLTVALVIIVAVLVVRPSGLFGRTIVVRV